MAKTIRSKKGLETLLQRYKDHGVTNQTKDASGSYEAHWLEEIEGCIRDGLAMDETDYENTPRELRHLWVGLR